VAISDDRVLKRHLRSHYPMFPHAFVYLDWSIYSPTKAFLAVRASSISVNLKIAFTASLNGFEFFFGIELKMFLKKMDLASLPTCVGKGPTNRRH